MTSSEAPGKKCGQYYLPLLRLPFQGPADGFHSMSQQRILPLGQAGASRGGEGISLQGTLYFLHRMGLAVANYST